MQTFMPLNTYRTSALALDNKRLGKQRVEAYQILRTLFGINAGWANHPAVKLWRGHEASLCLYAMAMCTEWVRRGFTDNLFPYFNENYQDLLAYGEPVIPELLLRKDLQVSHQSNLIRKDPAYYSKLFDGVPDNLPYIWE